MRTLSLTTVLPALAVPVLVWADTGVGVDTWHGDKLDPTGGQASAVVDPDGTSWLESGQHRTPTGYLYRAPSDPPRAEPLANWQVYGTFDVGYLHSSGDRTALFDRYARWPSDAVVFDLNGEAERASDGSYAQVRGSRISDEDQYYEAVYGKAGAYKAEVFVRDMPNVLTTDAKSIFNGVGSDRLTLAAGLAPGGSTPAQVAAVSAAAPYISLGVERNKQGIGLSGYLTPHWTAYLNVTDEERRGGRPYGGPFMLDIAGIGGAAEETVKPIDESTVNIDAGARYAGSEWRYDFGFSGSIYRDKFLSYTFQQPFQLGPPVVPGGVSATITQGQMSTEPDNEDYNFTATATRVLPLEGELSLTGSEGEMRQNDWLIPPTNCQGVFGIATDGSMTVGPGNPQLFPCSQWNTTAALSQQRANMLIVTTLTQGSLTLRPASDVTVRAGGKYYRQDYRNQYVMYNPQNGDYGYVAENGAQASIVPGDPGFWNAVTYPHATDTQVESIPYGWQTVEGWAGADWKASSHDTVGITYIFDHYDPAHREVTYANDDTIKLNLTDRSLGWATFRVNYTHLKQSGSVYNDDPYSFAFFQNLPGFVPADATVTAWTVNAMRKYDVAARTENKFDAMATVTPRPDMTLSASLRADYNLYPTDIGRQGYNTYAATLQWEWQLAPRTSVSAWGGLDRSSLHLANVNDAGAPLANDTPDDTLGGSTYPLADRWWAADEERNWSGGATVLHYFGPFRLDVSWNYLSARGITAYTFASPGALTYVSDAAIAASQFPAMTYVVNSAAVGLTVPVNGYTSLRFYDYWEHGQINDWHYAGFNNTLVNAAQNVAYLDAGPQGYNTNIVGVRVNVRL